MKILFIANSLVAGGTERRLLELIKYLKLNTCYEIALVITEGDIFYKYVYELEIKLEIIERQGMKYDPGLFVRFYRFCKEFNPDIIHTWGKMTTFYAIPTKLICRKPLVSNLIPSFYRKFSLMNNIFYAADIFFSDIILSNSEAGLRLFKINPIKARVIRNGVHLERFQGQFDRMHERLKINVTTDYMVVMVARVTKWKNYDLFLDIAKEIGEIRNDVTLVGVGDGPELNRIKSRIKNELINNVILTGDQTEVEPIIAAADIGLLCTNAEGISNSIIEYMALGKPVIATDLTGGTKEIIIEGVTGYCTRLNQKEIISLINLLLDNEKLRISMGEKGRERINSEFSIKKMGSDYEKLYRQVLNYKLVEK